MGSAIFKIGHAIIVRCIRLAETSSDIAVPFRKIKVFKYVCVSPDSPRVPYLERVSPLWVRGFHVVVRIKLRTRTRTARHSSPLLRVAATASGLGHDLGAITNNQAADSVETLMTCSDFH